ncbi:MAG: transcription elongation factor GreB [Gammaproteobacteria bacterium]|nr:transcription elongation factor GreB [Gammaproteobacteria bacterium]
MGHRYRPPAAKKSPYITAQGFQALQEEFSALWERRAVVTQALSEAAAEGDRSENAEYIYRKKELREIDRRIRYLQKRLPELTIVKQLPTERERVYFSAWVTLEDADGQSYRYRIVGPDEIDPERNLISMDSPMARALMKRSLDDEVTVMTPRGEREYVIVDVSYDEPEA